MSTSPTRYSEQLRLPIDGEGSASLEDIRVPGLTPEQDEEIDRLANEGYSYGEAFDLVLGTVPTTHEAELTLAGTPPKPDSIPSREEAEAAFDSMDDQGLSTAYMRARAGLDD